MKKYKLSDVKLSKVKFDGSHYNCDVFVKGKYDDSFYVTKEHGYAWVVNHDDGGTHESRSLKDIKEYIVDHLNGDAIW